MEYKFAFHTDVGIVKSTNQDSLLIKEAVTSKGNVVLAMVCDGMGGLEKGEFASAIIINEFSKWFEKNLPYQLTKPNRISDIKNIWNTIIINLNKRIIAHGEEHKIKLGSTVTAILILENGEYLIGHVGDSRIYKICNDKAFILTEDQTVVANEIRQGRLSPQEASNDPRRNVLLQCVGASKVVIPEFSIGRIGSQECYLICSDGFRHKISQEEIKDTLMPQRNNVEEVMKKNIVRLVEISKQRKERDNITAILIRTQ